VGAVLDGIVSGVDAAYGMADLQVGRGALNVSVRGVAIGDRVRVQLLARDIILATQAPKGLSVRNELQGRITELSSDEEDAVLVKVDVGGATVLARVTRAAVATLGLRPGLEIWVLVKAMSTRGHAFRLAVPDA
jgi:molybdate transport system ATP-binding protein